MTMSGKFLALLAFTPLAIAVASAADAATANATGNFSLTIPDTVSLATDAGNANDTFPAMTVTVDGAANATGSSSLTWNLNSNTVGGAIVTVYLPNLNLPASAGSNLKNDIKITVIDASGPQAITPAAPYVAGRALGAMPSTAGAAETMFSTSGPGKGRATLTLSLNAPPEDGSGAVTGTITMIATSQ